MQVQRESPGNAVLYTQCRAVLCSVLNLKKEVRHWYDKPRGKSLLKMVYEINNH